MDSSLCHFSDFSHEVQHAEQKQKVRFEARMVVKHVSTSCAENENISRGSADILFLF